MRTFAYNEPRRFSGHGLEVTVNTVITVTEADILKQYWWYWTTQMLKAHKAPLMTEANCIDDFVVVNWAWEVQP